MELPPSPAEPPLLQTLRWLARPLEFLDSCRRRYGDSFSLKFLGFETPMVMLGDPEALRTLYTSAGHGLPPGRTLALSPVVGMRSVLLIEGKDHLARRKAMLPSFHGERMRAYEETVREVAEREIAAWPEDEAFALHPVMQRLTLEVILRTVFGVTDPARLARLRETLPVLMGDTASMSLQFRYLLFRRFRRLPDPLEGLRALLEKVDGLLYEEIGERRAESDGGSGRSDVLSMLIDARFEDGSGMSDEELRDQLMTLLLAGHETTATALAWTFDLLLHRPDALSRLVGELAEGEDSYLRATITEALRLRPVVPLAGRRLGTELALGDRYLLPPGTDVSPAIWLIHTNPEIYPDPLAFRPERFLDGAPSTYGWVPFGGGVRRCLGAAFAEMEMRVVVSEALRARELRAEASSPERVARRNVTLAPRNGTRVSAPRAPARMAAWAVAAG